MRPPSRQFLVPVRKGDYSLAQTSSWTTWECGAPAARDQAGLPRRPDQVISRFFRRFIGPDPWWPGLLPIVLWASLWWGIAANAVSRARRISCASQPASRPDTGSADAQCAWRRAYEECRSCAHNWAGNLPRNSMR